MLESKSLSLLTPLSFFVMRECNCVRRVTILNAKNIKEASFVIGIAIELNLLLGTDCEGVAMLCVAEVTRD